MRSSKGWSRRLRTNALTRLHPELESNRSIHWRCPLIQQRIKVLLVVALVFGCEKREDYEPCPMTASAQQDCDLFKLSNECAIAKTSCSAVCAVTDHPQCESGPCVIYRFRVTNLDSSFYHDQSFCSLPCDPTAYECEGGGDCKDRSTTYLCADGKACDPSSRRCVRENQDGSKSILGRCDIDGDCNTDTCVKGKCVESGKECESSRDCYTVFCRPVKACANGAKCLSDADCIDGSRCAICQDSSECIPRCENGARCLSKDCPGDAECLPFIGGGLCIPRDKLNP